MTSTPAAASWAVVLRRLTAMEARQYGAVADWVRRRPDVPPGAEPIGYAGLAAPMLWLFVVGSAVEVAVVHVLLHPWPWLRWPALVLGVWSLLWMVGFVAAYRTRPHLAGADSLRVRAGAGVDLEVPYAAIDSVTVRERELGSSVRSSDVVDDDRDDRPGAIWCGIGVSGRTNLQLRLRGPLRIPAPGLGRAGEVEVTTLGCWVDEPRATARMLTGRVGRTGRAPR